ncbi:MAG: serine protease [Actinomycetota bacterium]|nr:serine protease [Actinomycetota bacterium]
MTTSEPRRAGASAVALAVLLGAVIGVGAHSLLPAAGSPLPPAPGAEVAARVLDRDATVRVEASGCGERRSATATVVGPPGAETVLTNAHVVRGAGTVEVHHDDGTTATATVVGAVAGRDAAVLRLDGDVPAAPPASTRSVGVGDDVVVTGFPGGERIEVTARVRSSELRSAYGGTSPVLLIDAPAAGGLSGGTVLDAATGDVVALVAARDAASGDVVAHPIGEVLGRSLGPVPGC